MPHAMSAGAGRGTLGCEECHVFISATLCCRARHDPILGVSSGLQAGKDMGDFATSIYP